MLYWNFLPPYGIFCNVILNNNRCCIEINWGHLFIETSYDWTITDVVLKLSGIITTLKGVIIEQ